MDLASGEQWGVVEGHPLVWGHAMGPVPLAQWGSMGRADSGQGLGVPGNAAAHPPSLPAQLKAFVSTLHFPLEGSTLLKMINNFRPPQPLHSRRIFASRGATASGGSLHRGHHQLLSPLLLLALLSLFLPAP